jgi:SagB-type dehydrogenase family enzyme
MEAAVHVPNNEGHVFPQGSAAEDYHEASKLRASDWATTQAVWLANNSPQIRMVVSQGAPSFRGAPQTVLPGEAGNDLGNLQDAFLRRRSCHSFTGASLLLEQLGTVLFFSAAVTSEQQDSLGIDWGHRSAPSGGALFPIDTYCLALNVRGLESGRYYHDPRAHSLTRLSEGDFREPLADAMYLHSTLETASACMVLVANFPRMRFKYGERTYRFALIEAGHIAQNMLLAAAALQLGALPVGGFVDDDLNAILGLDGLDQAALYAVVLGHPA